MKLECVKNTSVSAHCYPRKQCQSVLKAELAAQWLQVWFYHNACVIQGTPRQPE